MKEEVVLSIDDREWKSYTVGGPCGIFTVTASTHRINDGCFVESDGGERDIPYITQSKSNNGFRYLVQKQPGVTPNEGNCITIGKDWYAPFYQPRSFYTGDGISILRIGNLMTETTGVFLAAMLRHQHQRFYYGYKASQGRIARTKIMLPVDGLGEIDWDFMHDYVYERRITTLKRHVEIVSGMIAINRNHHRREFDG